MKCNRRIGLFVGRAPLISCHWWLCLHWGAGDSMMAKARTSKLRGISVIVVCICCLFLDQSSFAAAVRGWGSQVVDSTELGQKNHIAVSAGGDHGLALKADGSIVGWGYNWNGQASPPGGNDFIAVSAGRTHSLGLKANGSIAGWGDNESGKATPPAGNDFVAVSTGGHHSLALQRVCRYILAGDLNDDCEVGFDDFALMCANWLIDCYIDPPDPACVPN